MRKLSWANSTLIFLMGLSACSGIPLRRESVPVQPVVVEPPEAEEAIAQTPASSPQLTPEEAYQRSLDVAFSAASIAQSAQTPDDWVLVSSRWQEAINLLKAVPKSNQLYAIAQQKITQYQTSLKLARQKAKLPPPKPRIPTAIASSPGASPDEESTPSPSPTSTNPEIIQVPIKRRLGGTPVITVTFNGDRTFEMIVDTGASSTVITQKMATALGVVPTGEATADTASSKGVKFRVGKVKSLGVKGIVINEMQVAIAGRDLDIGLLGQDFFGNYDVTIKQDVIEFQQR